MSYSRFAKWAVLSVIVGCVSIGVVGRTLPDAPTAAYKKVEGWPQPSPDVKLTVGQSSVIGVLTDKGNVWMFVRADPPILEFDASGKLIKTIGKGIFERPHGFCMDGEGNIWAGDSGPEGVKPGEPIPEKGVQFHKFSQDGKLLMSLGKPGVSKVGEDTFIAPAACAIASNGDIIVGDGHIPRPRNVEDGDRIIRFSKTGKFIRAYGKTGKGPGEFRGIHQLAMDSQGRLFVADRSNSRIQVFDKDMKFVAEWRQFGRPSGMQITKNDTLIVDDWESGGPVPWPDWPGEVTGAKAKEAGATRNPAFKSEILARPFGPDTSIVRIGSAKDGSIRARFQTPKAEGIGMDEKGAIYIGPEKYVLATAVATSRK